jgi:serine-type D-Ala-D-Ala carboxypeptidase (penicillin-binding protein 5/6)
MDLSLRSRRIVRRVLAWVVTLAVAARGLGPALLPPHTATLTEVRFLAHTNQVAHPQEIARLSAAPDVASRVTAKGAVLWEPADNFILFGRNPDQPRRMASTTKIMTVLLALEARSLDEQVTVSPHAVAVGHTPGAADLHLNAGQALPMRSLLAGLILRSGNDAAVAVAEHIAGSEVAFVKKMNARARELGLTSTAFLDASGLTDDPGHHSSPLDLARLAVVAMARPEFASWAGAAKLDVRGLGLLQNRNKLISTYQGAIGVKTGYTHLAGLCLVASATRDGRTLYAVVLDSKDSFADVAALLDYGFTAFRRPAPVSTGVVATTYRWSGAQVGLVADEPLARTVPAGAAVVWRTVLYPRSARPVPSGAVLGHAQLVVDGHVVRTVDLHAQHAMPPPPAAARGALAGASVQDTIRAFARLRSFDRAVP